MSYIERYGFYRGIVERHGVYTPPFSFDECETIGSLDDVIARWRGTETVVRCEPETSIYLHVPFCSRRRCSFCMYKSTVEYSEEDLSTYSEFVSDEFAAWRNQLPRHLANLYVGGGTPSVYSPKGLQKLLEPYTHLSFDGRAEKTCEMSPSTATCDHIRAIVDCGLNRLSMGVQSFDERVLGLANRDWVPPEKIAGLCGFGRRLELVDVNLDLMLGLPGVNEVNIRDGVDRICGSGALSSSVYYWRQTGIVRDLLVRQLEWTRSEFEKHGWRLVSGSAASEHHLFQSPERRRETRRYRTGQNGIDNDHVVGVGLCANGFRPGFSYVCDAPDSFRIWVSGEANQYRMAAAHMLYDLDGRLDGIRFRSAFGLDLADVFQREISLLKKEGALVDDGTSYVVEGNGVEDRMAKQLFFWDQAYLERVFGGVRG